MNFSWDNVKRPILALAPMEGYTDSAFRQLIKTYVPEVICYTEFTSVDGLHFKNESSLKKIRFNDIEQPLIIQLFGKKPEHFITAAKIVEQLGAAAIDINMGCPAKNVLSTECGSALMKNPQLAAEIVNKLSKKTKLPVSVKCRLGFKDFDEKIFQNFCLELESAGAQMLAIHGRTTKQAFSGLPDWDPIYRIKEKLKIPVIGNGNIDSSEIALARLKNLDGVMVGRATFGNPLIMHSIFNALHKNNKTKKKLPGASELAQTHLKLIVKNKGEKRGLIEMRKHLSSYIKGFKNAARYRIKLVKVEKFKQALEILEEIKANSL